MDVLLVSFPKSKDIKKGKESVPVASLYLNAYLNKYAIDCDYIDFSVILPPLDIENPEAFIVDTLISKAAPSPRLFGLNCFSSYQFPLVAHIAERLKDAFPDASICIGGSHPTFFAREILEHCSSIDYVVTGEGEESLLALAKFLTGRSDQKLNQIQALGYRDDQGRITVNPRRGYLEDLSVNPREVWGAFRFEDYYSDHSLWNNPKKQMINLAVPIVSSRSCPFKCNFCSTSKIMGTKLRYRDPESVIDEIEYLHKERGQTYFEFVDDNINVRRGHAVEIFSGIIKRGIDVQFSLSSGIHLASVDEALIDLMAEAGLVMIKLPIEHGNDYIRNQIIGKNLERNQIIKIARAIKRHKIFQFGLFIMGFPEDTPQTLDDSYDLMCELELDIYVIASLIPFPGTTLFDQCVKDNLFLSDLPYNDLWKGVIHFDSSEHDKFYIKPYRMTINDLNRYRLKFEAISIFPQKQKEA